MRQPTTSEPLRFDRELGARLGVSFEQLADDAWKHAATCAQRVLLPLVNDRGTAPFTDDDVMSCYCNYVCDTCYVPLGACACHASWGPDFKAWGLVWVDPAIQEHVRLLKEKGYATEYHCAGHEPGEGPVIQFMHLHPFGLTLPVPPGFTWHKFRAALYATPLDPQVVSSMTLQELRERDEHLMADLLDWCRNLPVHRHDWYGYRY